MNSPQGTKKKSKYQTRMHLLNRHEIIPRNEMIWQKGPALRMAARACLPRHAIVEHAVAAQDFRRHTFDGCAFDWMFRGARTAAATPPRFARKFDREPDPPYEPDSASHCGKKYVMKMIEVHFAASHFTLATVTIKLSIFHCFWGFFVEENDRVHCVKSKPRW